ncbi:hypothetical protein llap_14006 [Limosa lapponica baueri]|uniref:Hook C-terminal domain-containing protein n=1 Tax=Limosa lapponica baueri TaxID=1758121 RepID=A0A2I0TPE0_LIMLA|nr:hypothetical protein llap_14006 [Limosa lapponica baueri]
MNVVVRHYKFFFTEHIQNIMTLEESVQHVVMTAIQELMSKEVTGPSTSDASSEMEQQLKKALEDLQEALAEKEELAQRCQELDLQVAALQDEKNSLMSENEIMNDRLDQLDDSLDDPNTVVAKKYFHAQLQLEQLQEENFRATADKASKLESTVEVYRKKLQDLNDFRRQVKSLQETNMMYMHNTVSLEDELKKANAARAQLETYKRQVQELHNKLSEESKRADKLAFEMKRLEEKHEALIKEKEVSLLNESLFEHLINLPPMLCLRKIFSERLIVQCDALKETNEELRYSQMQQDHLSQTGASRVKSHENLAAEILPVEYREMFIRLQHENKMLMLQQEGSENERITELQEQLEQKHRTVNELETEKRLNEERIGELQQQIEDLQKTLQEQGSKNDGSSNLKQKLAAHMEKLNEVHDELQKKEADLAELQPDDSQNPQKIGELEAALRKKDEDMKAMEERYKMYLEKARNVIKTLDPKLNPASAEIMLLRKQLTEKDKKIDALEAEFKLAKLRDYEEKLIVTAWYNKSMTLQKLGMESRLVGSSGAYRDGPGRSFLAQQRHVTNTRRNLTVKVQGATSD